MPLNLASLNVQIGGDSSGAVAAIRTAQGALDRFRVVQSQAQAAAMAEGLAVQQAAKRYDEYRESLDRALKSQYQLDQERAKATQATDGFNKLLTKQMSGEIIGNAFASLSKGLDGVAARFADGLGGAIRGAVQGGLGGMVVGGGAAGVGMVIEGITGWYGEEKRQAREAAEAEIALRDEREQSYQAQVQQYNATHMQGLAIQRALKDRISVEEAQHVERVRQIENQIKIADNAIDKERLSVALKQEALAAQNALTASMLSATEAVERQMAAEQKQAAERAKAYAAQVKAAREFYAEKPMDSAVGLFRDREERTLMAAGAMQSYRGDQKAADEQAAQQARDSLDAMQEWTRATREAAQEQDFATRAAAQFATTARDMTEAAIEFSTAARDAAVESFGSVADALTNQFGALGKTLSTLATDIYDVWQRTGMPSIGAIGTGLSSVLSANAGGLVSQALGGISDLLANSGTGKALSTEGGKMSATLSSALGDAFKGLVPVIRALHKAIEPLIVGLGKLLGVILSPVWWVLEKAIASIAWAVSWVVEGVTYGIRGLLWLVDQIPGIDLGGALDSIDGFIADTEAYRKTLFDNSAAVNDNTAAQAGLAETARSVAESLTNVPSGFRVALARYNATAERAPLEIPRFASGGIVTRPTIALVGEAGPEEIRPLGRGGARVSSQLSIGVLNVNGVQDAAKLARDLVRRAERESMSALGTIAGAAPAFSG